MPERPQPWAKEPWESHENNGRITVEDADGKMVMRFGSGAEGDWLTRANIPRIVACVNACAGVPTKWLTSLTDGEIKAFIEEHITDE